MSPMTAYRPGAVVLLVVALALAACTPGGPAAEAPDSPSPATPTDVPTAAPTDAPSPSPTAASTGTPTPIDYDYDYGYGGGGTSTTTPSPSPSPAESPTDGAFIGVAHGADHSAYLVGPDGLALYIFTQDDPGVSNCTGACAQAWPPLMGDQELLGQAHPSLTGTLGLIERPNGSMQVTYNDAPLYYFASDRQPGDTTGHEVGGVWFLARP